jgi:uncharacterized iron-regulated membrane protein
MIYRLRHIWIVVHRWLGLLVGLLFVMLGLTGSLLVFHHSLDEWLNPELLRTEVRGDRISPAEILQAAEKANRNSDARPYFAEPPRSSSGVWTVWFRETSLAGPRLTHVYVNPVSGEITGQRTWGAFMMTWIYRLHNQLLAGHMGETLVGLCGLILLISVISGILLWWPLWKHSWRAALAVRRGRRFNYDLHKTVGIFSAGLLLVIAFTGVYLVFPGWIRPLVLAVTPQSVAQSEDLRSQTLQDVVPIDASRAWEIGQSVFPDAEIKRIYFPAAPDKPYVVRMRQVGEVRRSSGNTRVWIDQFSGEVLGVRDWNQRTAADTFFAWQFPLHNGEAFGLWGRWIVFIMGLVPAFLYVTGFLIWWRRGRSRKKKLLQRGESA